jgi:putative protease
VEAGADAVYVGLKEFSARTYAENFTIAELAGVIRESRRAGVKIHLAFNSLVKESELGRAWGLLAAAAELGPDALIIQDWGLNRLAAAHFPQIPRHASTLTGVHSLPGLVALKEAGFTRAVLARELAYDEVAALSVHSPLGLEVFIHGALCFSASGLCLMSSFLGGRSALRGGCTQPCRRSYRQGRRQAALFSLADLALAPYLRELRQLPLAGLKIEGRMKGPDYVGRVVRAYRLLLDAPDEAWPQAWAEAESILAQVPGRRTCGGPWAARAEGPLAPLSQETTSGLKLGFMEPAGPGRGRLTLINPVARLDRLRLQAKGGEESAAFNLKGLWLDQETAVESAPAGADVIVESLRLPANEGWLFKIASGREERAILASPLVRALEAEKAAPRAFRGLPPELRRPSRPGPPRPGPPRFWIWLERAEDIREAAGFKAARLILPLTEANIRHVRRHRRHFKDEANKLVWSLPPLLFHRRQAWLGRELGGLLESGFKTFLAANLGHLNILKRAGAEIWADHRLGVLNHQAEAALAGLGCRGVTLSLEMDEETAAAFWARPAAAERLIYLYGRPALFTSRLPLESRETLVSPKGEKFRLAREGEAVIVISDRPVFLAPLLKKPPLPGGVGFILDLRCEAHLAEKLRTLKKALAAGAAGSQGSAFNLKRALL